MQTTSALAAKFAKVAGGLVLATLVLAGVAAQSAGAAEVAPKSHRADVVALDNTVLNRLNTIRSSFGLSNGVATTQYASEVSSAVADNKDPPFAPTSGGVVGEEGLWGMIPGTSSISAQGTQEIVNGWVYHDGWQG